jgi:hypothetical protein
MDHQDHYANAVRAEPGRCWRMVSRPSGYHVDTPMDCPEPVRWVGRAVVGRRRLKHWSGGRHLEGLDDLRPVGNRYITHPIGIATMICDGSDSLDDPEPIVDSHRAPIADWLRLSTEVGLVDSDVRLICPDSADHYHSANDHAVGNKPGTTRKRPPIFGQSKLVLLGGYG